MMNKELRATYFGEIKPSGWIKEQMQKDMDGFVGHLDQLVPGLLIHDQIYGEHRLTKKIKRKSVGNIPDKEWAVQYLWWNSESQSNWWDGYLRHAFMLDDKKHLQHVEEYIEYILSTQDDDGYLGIYAPDLRYNFNSENGELWSKATLYRVLLAYYEATKKTTVLEAVVKAVNNVMENFPIDVSTPFLVNKPYAGLSHGLAFTDVLHKLFQITGKEVYKEYAVFLYKDYCRHDVSEKDIQLKNILDPGYKLCCHGVHTYEHLRSLALAAFATGDAELQKALTIYLERIEQATTPSGGPIGDEWIHKRAAHATDTGYEYCSVHELMDSYLFLLQKTGDLNFAGKAEKIFLNAAQGARHPEQSSIAYLKTDNSFEMCGTRNGEIEMDKKQTRYKYSPVHQDVAVCCSPNAGRITPYFVQNMWMKEDEGLIACLFGPCELETTINGKKISIKEITTYPYDFVILFEIASEQPVGFVLKFRKPSWAKQFKLNVPFEENKDHIYINKKWKGTETIKLEFEPALERNRTIDSEVYFTYGPLVLAWPIEAIETRTKEYGEKNFFDTHYKPSSLKQFLYNGDAIKKTGSLTFKTKLFNLTSKKKETVSLVPLGKTILRQVSFKAGE